jgi:pilus assembly protein FimV
VLRPVESESTPLDADVDSAITLLFVVLRPVESPVESDSMPLEADVDSAATELFVVLRPVERVPT